MADLNDRLRGALEGPLEAAGVDLEAVDVGRAGRRRVVRFSVDADGGVTLDRVADLSRIVETVLDETGVLGDGPYVLEVGSPGVARPLTLPRHWRRNRGRLVRVTGHHDRETLTGRIVDSTDDSVTLVVDGRQTTIALADIRTAVVQVEMERGHGH